MSAKKTDVDEHRSCVRPHRFTLQRAPRHRRVAPYLVIRQDALQLSLISRELDHTGFFTRSNQLIVSFEHFVIFAE
jgi:hypothetical protein